ncbi:MAG: hypothetical protein AAB425_00385, partial [Bdellovibrionota bacterium]
MIRFHAASTLLALLFAAMPAWASQQASPEIEPIGSWFVVEFNAGGNRQKLFMKTASYQTEFPLFELKKSSAYESELRLVVNGVPSVPKPIVVTKYKATFSKYRLTVTAATATSKEIGTVYEICDEKKTETACTNTPTKKAVLRNMGRKDDVEGINDEGNPLKAGMGIYVAVAMPAPPVPTTTAAQVSGLTNYEVQVDLGLTICDLPDKSGDAAACRAKIKATLENNLKELGTPL